MFEIQNQVIWHVLEKTASTLKQLQVPNGTVPGARSNYIPLLAMDTRFKYSMETSLNEKKIKIGNKVQFGSNIMIDCNIWSLVGVNV